MNQSHVDPTVDWHGEPHVVRVGVDGILGMAIIVEVFPIVPVTPILCEDLDALGQLMSIASVQDCIHQYILCC